LERIFKGEGQIKDFVGNYSDYREMQELQQALAKKERKAEKPVERPKKSSVKVTYKEQKEFEKLEEEIPLLEEAKQKMLDQMNSGNLSPDELNETSKKYQEISDDLDEKELRWLELSEKMNV
jgi:ATP-binding cassette subfamily F protein uup